MVPTNSNQAAAGGDGRGGRGSSLPAGLRASPSRNAPACLRPDDLNRRRTGGPPLFESKRQSAKLKRNAGSQCATRPSFEVLALGRGGDADRGRYRVRGPRARLWPEEIVFTAAGSSARGGGALVLETPGRGARGTNGCDRASAVAVAKFDRAKTQKAAGGAEPAQPRVPPGGRRTYLFSGRGETCGRAATATAPRRSARPPPRPQPRPAIAARLAGALYRRARRGSARAVAEPIPDRVGLFFPKSVESIISMLGVLKAGGVYVPLDPQAPADRVGYIIGNCGIRVLITNSEKRQVLAPET